jgi:diguanylate cyclase (GGDEF)-like protein
VRTVAAASAGLAVVLVCIAAVILHAQAQSRARVDQFFALRASASATLVGTYLAGQAQREKQTAERLLSAPRVPASRFDAVVSAFGSRAAVLLDGAGRVLRVTPAAPGLVGRPIAAAYKYLESAEHGVVAVSGVVPSAATREAVTAVAVPFRSRVGARRVFSVGYPVSGPELRAFVDRAVAYPQHEVALVDASGRLLASSPLARGGTFAASDPGLAARASTRTMGSIQDRELGAATFASAPVPGTPWKLVVAVPDSRLYASIAGLARLTPWLVFALVTLLGMLLLAMFARLLADRARLADLSRELAAIARTDPLTGLLNRRGLQEGLTRAAARARRRSEPLTVLMIDLDRFKEINDRCGHEAGDRVLKALAECMRGALRSEDVYGRVGGDEFLVALSDADQGAGRATASRLVAAGAAVDLRDVGIEGGIPMSIGIASGIHTTSEELIRAADAELYRVKGARRAAAGAVPAPPRP